MKKETHTTYGIKITKPFSENMYNHNDMVATQMKSNIKDAWHNEAIKFMGNDKWPAEGKIVDIQKSVQAIGICTGHTIDDVQKDFLQELEYMADWQLHEEYSYMSFKNLVPRTRFMMVGFDWQKHDYSYCTDIDLSEVVGLVEQAGNIHDTIAEEVKEIRTNNKI